MNDIALQGDDTHEFGHRAQICGAIKQLRGSPDRHYPECRVSAEIEEITNGANRRGVLGYLRSTAGPGSGNVPSSLLPMSRRTQLRIGE
jgi:hypothetical protein